MNEPGGIASCMSVRHPGDSYPTSGQLIIEMKILKGTATGRRDKRK
jgi:hypothetical protein